MAALAGCRMPFIPCGMVGACLSAFALVQLLGRAAPSLGAGLAHSPGVTALPSDAFARMHACCAALPPSQVPSFTATKLLWLKRHEPEVFAAAAHVLLPHDYINWWLTGRQVVLAAAHESCCVR